MKIGSLFSGIGGLELGLERATGGHTVWQVEQDPYARAVLAKHWPKAKRFENVEKVGAHNLAAVDLICGGFPCQDVSNAGKRAGLDGARSGLWTEYARIIGDLRPRFVVVENVSALLARGMDRVLGDLAACGYDAIWDCIPAAAVGAPHRRDRLFVVAYSNSGWRSNNELQTGGHKLRVCRTKLADTDGTRLERHRPAGNVGEICPQKAVGLFRRSLGHVEAWKLEPQLGRVATGVPRRVDRLRCLGNAVVPQVAEVIGRVIVELDRGR